MSWIWTVWVWFECVELQVVLVYFFLLYMKIWSEVGFLLDLWWFWDDWGGSLVRIWVVGICDFCWICGILSKYVSKWFWGFEVERGWWWEIWRWEVEIFELRCGWNWYALLTKRTLVLKCKLRPVRTQSLKLTIYTRVKLSLFDTLLICLIM